MEFLCAICDEWWLVSHCAFAFAAGDDRHGVCYECVEEGM